MNVNKMLKKIGMLAITLSFIAVTFSSCHREGCPGKINHIDQAEQVESIC